MRYKFIIYFILLLLFPCCINKEYTIYKSKNSHSELEREAYSCLIEITNDSILYYSRGRGIGRLAKGKIKMINEKQMVFTSENNYNAVKMKVSEEFKNDLKNGEKMFCFKNIYHLGKFASYINPDTCDNLMLFINDGVFGYRFKIIDTIKIFYPFDIKRIFFTYETERLATNSKLRTIDYNVKDNVSNYFEIETFFNDYLVYSYNRVDTITILPLGRLKINDVTYKKILIKKPNERVSNGIEYKNYLIK